MAAHEICTLAQQAGEKALKALLIAEQTRPPATHNLIHLRSLLRCPIDVVDDAALGLLSDWSVKSRYPGDWLEPAADDAAASLAIARRIVEASVDRLAIGDG